MVGNVSSFKPSVLLFKEKTVHNYDQVQYSLFPCSTWNPSSDIGTHRAFHAHLYQCSSRHLRATSEHIWHYSISRRSCCRMVLLSVHCISSLPIPAHPPHPTCSLTHKQQTHTRYIYIYIYMISLTAATSERMLNYSEDGRDFMTINCRNLSNIYICVCVCMRLYM